MIRTDIINSLIHKFNYKSYLEIGIQNGVNFKRVICKYKIGIDPDPKVELYGVYKMTSDQFFKQNKEIFDICFIDGLHHADQVYRDIVNSLGCLSSNGTVVCHDMNPENAEMQEIPRKVKIWTGDCWKAWVRLEMKNVEKFVVDTDFGVGVIKPKGKVEINYDASMKKLSYDDLEQNRKKVLNLITVQEFKNWLNVQ
jgi:hypothetical protein